MGAPIFFAPLRTPLIDPRTNLMTREWYLFFQALWRRTGGAVDTSFDDLLQNPDGGGLGSNELVASIQAVALAADELPANYLPVELLKEFDSLKQGVEI